jgi:hypothetical protein
MRARALAPIVAILLAAAAPAQSAEEAKAQAAPKAAAAGKAITLEAVKDFPIRTVHGMAETRIEKEKGVISVDADKTGYSFGMAQTKWKGPDGVYDATLTTIQDGDGVCEYFLRAGKTDTDKFTQTGTKNGAPETHTWKGIVLRKGDLLGVAGNGSDTKQNAPGKGPKGFHMAHGRWSKLELVRTGPAPAK